MVESLKAGFVLDRLWHWMRGEMDRSKEPDLAAVVRVLSSHRVSYAVIGGVALQIHQKDPRTTIDVDIAVPDRGRLPREALIAAGFTEAGRHEHSEHWTGPGRSKRLQDLADAQALLEHDPALAGELTPAERALLDQLPD